MSPHRRRREVPELGEKRAAALIYLRERSIVTKSGCWEWQGHRNPKWQYGQACFSGRQWMAHRLAYAAANGPFPKELDICHRCDNPPCCNPEHLWLGTPKENMQDASRKKRIYLGTLTHCIRGHAFTGDNLYVTPDGRRSCVICDRGRQRVRAGWPEHLAYSLPAVPHGHAPVGGKFHKTRKRLASSSGSRE